MPLNDEKNDKKYNPNFKFCHQVTLFKVNVFNLPHEIVTVTIDIIIKVNININNNAEMCHTRFFFPSGCLKG